MDGFGGYYVDALRGLMNRIINFNLSAAQNYRRD